MPCLDTPTALGFLAKSHVDPSHAFPAPAGRLVRCLAVHRHVHGEQQSHGRGPQGPDRGLFGARSPPAR